MKPWFVCHACSSATRADTGVNEAPCITMHLCVSASELPSARLMRFGKITAFSDHFRDRTRWCGDLAGKITHPPISLLRGRLWCLRCERVMYGNLPSSEWRRTFVRFAPRSLLTEQTRAKHVFNSRLGAVCAFRMTRLQFRNASSG